MALQNLHILIAADFSFPHSKQIAFIFIPFCLCPEGPVFERNLSQES